MRYVLDTSVALKWVLPEPDSDKAIRLRDEYHAAVHELVSPDLFSIEVLHGLTRAERRRRIQPGDGWPLWQSVLADLPVLRSHVPLLKRAYEISSAEQLGVYDCLYVSLAEREGCQFVTADDKLVKKLQTRFSFIAPLSSLP
jgi:predicted nucleic acid-binding protein